jgi:predicted nuclease with TOPRIM domain
MESDAAAEMLERRWFATFKAASAARAECEALLEAMAMTEAAWARAREQLAKLEALRDVLAEELAELDGPPRKLRHRLDSDVCSAA